MQVTEEVGRAGHGGGGSCRLLRGWVVQVLHLPLSGIVVTHSVEGNPHLCEMTSDSTHARSVRQSGSRHAYAMPSTGEAEWRVLENGVLATPTSIEVVPP